MFQIRLHGRGERGVVSAAEMLSIAAFCRIDDKPIRLREPVMIPIQDTTLLPASPATPGSWRTWRRPPACVPASELLNNLNSLK